MEENQLKEEIFKALAYISQMYYEHYPYIYSLVIVYGAEKPLEPVLEIERAFSHLMQAIKDLNEGDNQAVVDNLRRMKGHVERNLLDLYKLGFFYFWETVKKYREILLELKAKEFLNFEKEFRNCYREIREREIKQMGNDGSFFRKEVILKDYRKKIEHLDSLWTTLLKNLKSGM